jgi:hypothetical protein
MQTPAVVLGILLAPYALQRAALWAEARGFVDYGRRRGDSGTLGNALLELQSIIEPSRRHVLEERVRDPVESRESGKPPARS